MSDDPIAPVHTQHLPGAMTVRRLRGLIMANWQANEGKSRQRKGSVMKSEIKTDVMPELTGKISQG